MFPQSTPKIMTWLEFTLSKDIIYIYSGKWNICNKNLQLCPLKRRRGPSFNQSWISLAKWCFVSNLVKIGRAVLDMKSKMWHLQTDRQTDDSREVVTKSYLIMSFQLRWEKKATVCTCVRNSHQINVQNLIFIVVSFDNSFGKKEYKK